jgi:Secretion system C-terminal sorting domain
MKKTTPQKLSTRLAQYSALTVAIAGIADASGQIVYTDITPDFDQGVGIPYSLDLNNDGTIDFEIYLSSSSSNLKIKPLLSANEVLGSLSSYYYNSSNSSSYYLYALPYVLSNGDPISNSVYGSWINSNSYSASAMDLNYSSCSRGNWCGVTDKYLGLRFIIGEDIHYGWARLDVGEDGSFWVIKDYAYNATPNEAINAGQLPLSIDDNELSKIKIVALNKSITLFNLPQTTNYKIFNMTGQIVLDGEITNSTYVIEANTLATGVYIIELQEAESNAVIRKKIVL